MVNDIEVPIFLAIGGDIVRARGLMHSVVGVLTLNGAITMVAVYVLVPRLMRWADRRWRDPRIFRFAGQDLHDDPRDPLTVYACACFGGLTHILIDLPTHAYNPIWWPWQRVPLTIVPFAEDILWALVAGIPVLALFVWQAYAYWRR